MKFVRALLLLCAWAAPALAADPTALTPEKLGEILTNLALEPKDISLNGAKDIYQVTSEQNGSRLFITIMLSTDHTVVWFELKTAPVPDPSIELGDSWYRLLKANADITPAYFSFNEKDRRIYLNMSLDNRGLTPAVIRKNYDIFAGDPRSTAGDWSLKNFRPIPTVPPLDEEGKAFVNSLRGEWLQVGEELKGEKSLEANVKAANIVYAFADQKVLISAGGGTPIEATVWAEPGNPGTFDLYFPAARAIEKGIATLEGDTLTLCYVYHGVERPKTIATTPDFRGGIRVLKRKSP